MKMHRVRLVVVLACAATAGSVSASTQTAFSPSTVGGPVLTPGDLLVYQENAVGGFLANTGASVVIDEINPSTGNVVATYATGMYGSGTANQEGLLTVNSSGSYLAIPGYVSTSSSGSLNGSTVNREIAVVNLSSNQADTTLIDGTTSKISGSIYSAYTDDDTNLYAGTQNGGIWTATDQQGSSTPTTGSSVVPTPASVIGLTSYGNTFYYTSGTTQLKLYSVAADPTTSTTSTNIAQTGISGSKLVGLTSTNLTGGSAADTLWVADQGNNEILRFDLVGSTWDQAGALSLSSFTSTNINVEDIAGVNLGNGDEELFVTLGANGGTSGGSILELDDDSGDGGVLGTLTAGTPTTVSTLSGSSNETYRGLVVIPVPEPAVCTMLSICALTTLRRRRANTTALRLALPRFTD